MRGRKDTGRAAAAAMGAMAAVAALAGAGPARAQDGRPPIVVTPKGAAPAAPAGSPVLPGSVADPVPGGFAGAQAAKAAAPSAPQSAPAAAAPRREVVGVTPTEVRFGLSAPLSGPSRDVGRMVREGIEAAFAAQDAAGGVAGRKLTLVVRDDGYEPDRAAANARALREGDGVFATIGDVGTSTAKASLPYAMEAGVPKLFPFTGSDELRAVPPDRLVFNLRASYGEETAAAVRYLTGVRGLKASEIALFVQDDDFGKAGEDGAERAMRALPAGRGTPYAVVTYRRNTMDVSDAVARLKALARRQAPPKAVLMAATYKAAAQMIQAGRQAFPAAVFTDVSFAGSTQLAEELKGLGQGLAQGVFVTQVVPDPLGHSREVEAYRAGLAKAFPGEQPDYASLEGWLDARLLIEGLGRAGRNLDAASLADALETVRDYDLGTGTPVSLSSTEHQASHYVWGTALDADGRYHAVDVR